MSVILISANRSVIVVNKGISGTILRLSGRTIGSLAGTLIGSLRTI